MKTDQAQQWVLAGWRLHLAILAVTHLAPLVCIVLGHQRARYSRLEAFARLAWCRRCRRAVEPKQLELPT